MLCSAGNFAQPLFLKSHLEKHWSEGHLGTQLFVFLQNTVNRAPAIIGLPRTSTSTPAYHEDATLHPSAFTFNAAREESKEAALSNELGSPAFGSSRRSTAQLSAPDVGAFEALASFSNSALSGASTPNGGNTSASDTTAQHASLSTMLAHCTPLLIAAVRHPRSHVAEVLLAHGADRSAENKMHQGLLHLTVLKWKAKELRRLMNTRPANASVNSSDYKIDPNLPDQTGATPLMMVLQATIERTRSDERDALARVCWFLLEIGAKVEHVESGRGYRKKLHGMLYARFERLESVPLGLASLRFMMACRAIHSDDSPLLEMLLNPPLRYIKYQPVFVDPLHQDCTYLFNVQLY